MEIAKRECAAGAADFAMNLAASVVVPVESFRVFLEIAKDFYPEADPEIIKVRACSKLPAGVSFETAQALLEELKPIEEEYSKFRGRSALEELKARESDNRYPAGLFDESMRLIQNSENKDITFDEQQLEEVKQIRDRAYLAKWAEYMADVQNVMTGGPEAWSGKGFQWTVREHVVSPKKEEVFQATSAFADAVAETNKRLVDVYNEFCSTVRTAFRGASESLFEPDGMPQKSAGETLMHFRRLDAFLEQADVEKLNKASVPRY
jgi:hypothetical protein